MSWDETSAYLAAPPYFNRTQSFAAAGHAPASPVQTDWQDKARTVAGFPAKVTELPLL
jgi:hypothetical protein